MTRLEKELRNRGIIFEADELDIMKGAEYDNDAVLIDVTDQVIIIGWYSMVMPNRYELYDRKTLEFIGSQEMTPDYQSFVGSGKMNPWDVTVNIEENHEQTAPFMGEDPFICAEDWM